MKKNLLTHYISLILALSTLLVPIASVSFGPQNNNAPKRSLNLDQQVSASTTTIDLSIPTTTTTETTTTSTTISTSAELIPSTTISTSITSESVVPVTSTSSSSSFTTPEEILEPTTVTSDSLSVNNDDSATSREDSTASEDAELLGGEGIIEGKSINSDSANSGNAVNTEPSSKLNLDSSIENESSSTDDTPAATGPLPTPPPSHTDSNVPPPSVKPAPYKNPHPANINMSLVDKNYVEGIKEEKDTVEAWTRMTKKLKKNIGGIIGSIVPFALNMSQEARISSECSGAMLKWVLSINQLKAWSMRMLDASGKPIAGLLEGSLTMFGNYRECLKIRAPDDDEIEFSGEFREYFRGKYCIIQAKPWLPEKSKFYNLNAKIKALTENGEENAWYDRTIFEELSEWILAFNFVNIRMDVCVPSLCSREDMQKALTFLLRGIDMKARVLRCETESPKQNRFSVASLVETGSNEVNDALIGVAESTSDNNNTTIAASIFTLDSFSQLGWLLVPMIAISLVILATAISMTFGNDNNIDVIIEGKKQRKYSKLSHTIHSLSLKRSVSSHLNVDYDQLADDKPLALYGVRLLIIFWIILVESAVNLKFEYLRELLMLKDLIFWWPMQIIINSTLQFDSIILLTAFTMSYKNSFNDNPNYIKSISKFVIDKYIRLMPSIMVMVALVILLPLTYRGPVWNDYVTRQSAVCQSTGWLNTVFLQNYLPYKEICLPQTWLISVEFQLVVLMAPIIYYLNKSYLTKSSIRDDNNYIYGGNSRTNKSTMTNRNDDKPFDWLWTLPGAILLGCILLGSTISFYNVYYNELPPSWFYTMADPDSKALYFTQHLMRIWTHLAVFSLGIIAGVECRRASRNVICGYKGTNMRLMSDHHNHVGCLNSGQHNKSHLSASTSSLPVNSTFSLNDTLSSSTQTTKTPNHNHLNNHINNHQQDNNNNSGNLHNSSISIDIQTNCSSSNENINSCSENGLNSNSSSSGGINHPIIHERNNNNNAADAASTTTNRKFKLFIEILGFLLAITIMIAIIFGTHEWSLNDLPKPLESGIFDVGSRLIWSMALIWMLYMVSVPNKDREFSLIAKSLGHPAMVCLGKLSFLIYIIHPFVHTTFLAIQEQPIYSSWLMLFHILVGNLTITVILAFLVSIFVEMPCRNLFRRYGTSLLLTHHGTIGSTSSSSATATSSSAAAARLR